MKKLKTNKLKLEIAYLLGVIDAMLPDITNLKKRRAHENTLSKLDISFDWCDKNLSNPNINRINNSL